MDSTTSMLERLSTVGCNNDWAMWPMRRELKKMAARKELGLLEQGTMTSLIEESKVATAPCCVTALIKNPQLELSLPLGLSMRGATGWAYLGVSASGEQEQSFCADFSARLLRVKSLFSSAIAQSPRDFSQVARTLITAVKNGHILPSVHVPAVKYPAGTSAFSQLSRVIYCLLYGDTVYEENEMFSSNGGSFANAHALKTDLLSGSEALQRKNQYNVILDLSSIWEQITGLPFVSCVWLRGQDQIDLSLKAQLMKIADFAQASMKVQPTGYFPDIMPQTSHNQAIDLAQFWKNISYRLGVAEMRGLLLFLNLARFLSKKQAEDDLLAVKMIRLQQREQEFSAAVVL